MQGFLNTRPGALFVFINTFHKSKVADHERVGILVVLIEDRKNDVWLELDSVANVWVITKPF